MKRFLPLFLIALAFSSCQEDVKFNNPGFQAQKDDVFWRANDARAYINETGKLTIEALTQYETVTLNTASADVGVYVLGTTNTNNSATYSSNFNDVELGYATIAVPGPVGLVNLTAGGSGYTAANSVATTGGSGSGLTVNTGTNANGVVNTLTVSSRGNGYVAGDLITISGGNVNAKFRVFNVQNSNGEIEITEYDELNFTVSGKFKFNAANLNQDDPFGGPILNFQYGEFYRIPIFPSL
jgi:hypothetical protein